MTVIWVYGAGEDGILAFTGFGIESLIELINMHKNDPTSLTRSIIPQQHRPILDQLLVRSSLRQGQPARRYLSIAFRCFVLTYVSKK